MVGSLVRLLCLFACLIALPLHAQTVRDGHMQAELVPQQSSVAPGTDILLGIRQIPDKGWHTYWVNPGETGLPADVSLNLPKGVTAGPIEWPTPQRLSYGGVITYGYTEAETLLISVHAAAYLKAGQVLPVAVHVESLVCAQTCEPVSFDLKTSIETGAIGPSKAGPGPLAEAISRLPRTLNVKAGMTDVNETVSIGFVRPADKDLSAEFAHSAGAYLFSESDQLLSPAAVQSLSRGSQGLSFIVKGTGAVMPATPQYFVLKFNDGRAWRLQVSPGPVPAGTYDIGAPPVLSGPNAIHTAGIAMIFAFLGGLILNLMPCVFPVLSMKLLALTRAGHDKGLARAEALTYGAGAIASFVGLSLVLNLMRAAGESLGWGFQLQSPLVTAALSLLLLLVGLNMSGVFEVGGSLQAVAGGQSVGKNPYIAAFLTGVLAVVVAAPCSAPFMATAMGVALSQGGLTSVEIFTCLGLGFALPFVCLTFLITSVPQIGRLMPRPGRWMDTLRHLLAIPMYIAALWMVWVFAKQTNLFGVCLLVGGMALIALCLLSLAMPKMVRSGAWFIAALLCITAGFQKPDARLEATGNLPFSPQQIAVWRSQNRPVLVDMTAAWCVTCKVNERVALSDEKVKAALDATHTVYMVGDWTHQDAGISDYIHQFGRSGVPLYVYYGRDGAKPVVLPQILTPSIVIRTVTGGGA